MHAHATSVHCSQSLQVTSHDIEVFSVPYCFRPISRLVDISDFIRQDKAIRVRSAESGFYNSDVVLFIFTTRALLS